MIELSSVIQRTRVQIETLRDALAVLSATSAVGQARELAAAAQRLESASHEAAHDCRRVQRLIRLLGAHTMPEAAVALCQGGRRPAAREMMALHETTRAVAAAQAEIGIFLSECLSSLNATRQSAARQSAGGRLIGSA